MQNASLCFVIKRAILRETGKGGIYMAVPTNEQEAARIEQLAEEAELLLAGDDSRKDLKEMRGIIKETLYDGSKKLKHLIPKGKHL